MKVGIVGLPNVGKSTLFNALTKAGAQVAEYPFTTVEKNKGMVQVPDERLLRLGDLLRPKRLTPVSVEFVDIAGLVKGAAKGEGLGNQFLAHIREVDLILHVVRSFRGDISHVEGTVDPLRDIEIVNLELCLKDLETVEKRLEKIEKQSKSADREASEELPALESLKERLERGERVKGADSGFNLLTSKPVIYVANLDEETLVKGDMREVQAIEELARSEGAPVVAVCCKAEAEFVEVEPTEAESLRDELGLKGYGVDRLISLSFELLGLVRFYTVKGEETRAWAVPRGTRVVEAAGQIHTDMEKGFIKAEVVGCGDLLRLGSLQRIKEAGLLRIEGRDYPVRDGDVILIRFAG